MESYSEDRLGLLDVISRSEIILFLCSLMETYVVKKEIPISSSKLIIIPCFLSSLCIYSLR